MKEIKEFEKLIANYYNARFAVATDCCTHAIELCLRLKNPKSATCPTHTYVSVPMTLRKLDIPCVWTDLQWQDFYYLTPNIIDAAVYWQQDGYKHGTLMCLSFQYRKHLNVGRGGMILLDNEDDYKQLCKMRYDGRLDDIPWMEQDIDTMGYHYYMTPETALLGIERFHEVVNKEPKHWSYKDYPNVSEMKVFN
jgi:dTDP-4-amino-4,6-dideoxygalactose transaminase